VRVAYLTNQYPKTSHTFVRREIAALEAQGLQVERFSVRAVDEPLVEAEDLAEQARTRILLGKGARGLLPQVLATSLRHPLRVLGALRTALTLGRGSQRGVARHLAYLAEACLLLRWSERLGIEHLHVHFATNPADVALLCRALGGPPFSFTAHGTADLGGGALATLGSKVRAAVFVVAVCEDGRRRILARTPRGHEHKVQVVRCGVDRRLLESPVRPIEDAARLVCVARLSREKGLTVLLRAAAVLAREGLKFELALIGDGPERGALEELRRELRLDGHVRFEGWQGGAVVQARIVASRALVLASLSEGLPIVLMEALALGRPVIATAVGGVAELVRSGDCGWLVRPGSVLALAAAMRSALTLPGAELDALGRRGAEHVAREHDAARQARVLARLFDGARRACAPAPCAAP